jgi:uncharacterized phage-associated protein
MPNKLIKFQYDSEKAKQAVLWLLHKNNGSMDKLQLVKLFFFADREHLARYGRPIIGGTYYAMKFGPVCSELLDCLDSTATTNISLPFILLDKQVAEKQGQQISNEDWLSESDLEVLEDIYKNYGHIDKFRLSDMTHDLKAYKKNMPPANSRKLIPYEDFFEDLDNSVKSILEIIYDEQDAWADFD